MKNKIIKQTLLMTVFLIFAATGSAAVAQNVTEGSGTCTGHFVNPITDICWECLFPISLGAIPVWPSGKPDPKNPAFVCFTVFPFVHGLTFLQ